MPETAAAPIAGVRDVTRRFPGVTALREINLDFSGGEVHALLGENGSGKSTLVKVLSGALRPSTGHVTIGGEPVLLANPRAALLAGIATSYQESALIPALSVAENLLLGDEPSRLGLLHPRGRAIAQSMLDEIGLDVDPGAPVGALSVGARQMVAIARALSRRARLFIFDEPTASLTKHESDRLFELIRLLRARGMGIIYITHRLAEVDHLADKITILKDGQVVQTLSSAETDRDSIIRMIVGRDVSALFPELSEPDAETALSVADLVSQNEVLAIDNFHVRRGEIVGVAGLDGSGRAELVRILGGAEAPRRGVVRRRGAAIDRFTCRQALRSGVAYVPPDRLAEAIVPAFSVEASISQSALRRFVRGGLIRPRAERGATRELVERLGIRTRTTETAIRTLSGGNQQKAVLARALCAQAQVLICDEPTAGVDVGARAEIYELFAGLARDGMSIVVSSSDLLELSGLCHRVVVLCEGRPVAELDAEQATEESLFTAQLPDHVNGSPIGETSTPGDVPGVIIPR